MSSSKEPPYLKNPITKEDISKIQKVFSVLENDPQSYDFLEPVDYITLNLLDYPTIIKHPMDLGTAKKNLLNNKYPTFQDFLNDIDLIWKNCRTYNMQGSDIVKMANHLEKVFKRQMEKQFKNYNNNLNNSNSKSNSKNNNNKDNNNIGNNSDLTMTEKMNLTEKIRILSNEGLTQVVKLIMDECPDGIEDIDSEKLQIKVDLIDHKTYDMLLELIEKENNDDKNK